jgi:putative cardiolipin synthase
MLSLMLPLFESHRVPRHKTRTPAFAALSLGIALALTLTVTSCDNNLSPQRARSADDVALLPFLLGGPQPAPGQGVMKDSELAIIDHGNDMFAHRVRLIDEARISIRLQSLYISDDETGRVIADGLMRAATRGVRVHLLVDDLLSLRPSTQRLMGEMLRGGVSIEGHDAGYVPIADALLGRIPRPQAIQMANMRYHEKYFVVDAEDTTRAIAILGGSNTASEYYQIRGNEPKWQWHDKDIAVRGPLVATVAQAFDENFLELRAWKNSPAQTSSPFWQTMQKLKEMTLSPTGIGFPAAMDPVRLAGVQEAIANIHPLVFKPARAAFLRTRPKHGEYFITRAYLDMINKAQQEILILNAYFIPTPELEQALVSAARRGVQVHIVTNHSEASDISAVQAAGRKAYQGMLFATQDLDNAQRLTIREWGGEPIFHNGQGMNHGKYMVIDGQRGIVGSFNLDPRSFYLDSESIIIYESAAIAAELRAQWQRDAAPNMSRMTFAGEFAQPPPDEDFNDSLQRRLAESFAAYL